MKHGGRHGGRRKGAGRKPGKVDGLPHPVRYSTVIDALHVKMIGDIAVELGISKAEAIRVLIARGYFSQPPAETSPTRT